MVLNSVGAGLLNQSTLYADNHDHTSWDQNLYDSSGKKIEWATNPDGLVWTLNHYDPQTTGPILPHYYVDTPLHYYPNVNSEDAISRKIAWTIQHYEVAPCVLVMGAQHWIVVRGMEVSKAPTGGDDTTYSITSFRVNDPWPPVPSSNYWPNPTQPPPPPHSASDGCGSGGIRGVADEVILYQQWQSTYLTGAKYHPQGHWQGLYVAVCDPTPPATRPGLAVRPIRRFDGVRLISPEQVLELAAEVMKTEALPRTGVWERSLRDVNAASPILVNRLDRFDDYYYIVPLNSANLEARAALLFDARFGHLQQATSFPSPDRTIANAPNPESVMRRIAGKTYLFEKYEAPLPAREEAIHVLGLWFWKPCLESLSPLWPFRLAYVGGRPLFFRIDGQVFTSLHENVLGL
ncbi:MAG TPA: hypothetical protein VMS37_11610 [Verrucomicrobiae bacterium]|nr:hypothetical protein [Verrucomicrobiae bacterium]